MSSRRPLAALSIAAALAFPLNALAAEPAKADERAGLRPEAAASAPASAMEGQMEVMRQMHDKMMNAKTPEERQALMADHMKAMQGGMQMMKGMSGMGGMGSMDAKGARKPTPSDMAKRQQMMERRMDTMQMTMEMMMQRMPNSAPPAGK
jgi:hypothetical protein